MSEVPALLTERYIRFVLRHHRVVLLACAVVTGVAAYGVSRGVFASSMIKLFFDENPQYDRYQQFADRFGYNDPVVIAFAADDIFTPEGWAELISITESIEAIDMVRRVDNITTANRIHGAGDVLEVESYADVVARSGDFATLRREIMADELLRGLVVTEDGCCVAMLVEIKADNDRAIETLPPFIEQLYAPFLAAGYHRDQVYMAGLIPETVEATAQARFSINQIFPATLFLLVVTVYLLFAQLWPVIITTGVALISLIWTFAFAILLDPQINIMMATVPAVMMIVAFSDIIHLCSSYILELHGGRSKEEAIIKSGSEVGVACFYTSVTTGVGFVSLVFVPAPLFSHLGIVLGAGVAIALLLAMTLVPIFFTLMPAPVAARAAVDSRIGRAVRAASSACLELSIRRPMVTLLAFVLLTVVALVGVSKINVETSVVERLHPENPVRRAQRFITEYFAGVTFVDVYVSVDAGDLLDAETFSQLAEFQRRMTAIDGVDSVQSLLDVMRVLHRELGGAGLPQGRALLAQYLLLFEMSGGDSLEKLIDEERKTMRMVMRLSGTGLVRTARIGRQVEEEGRDLIDAGLLPGHFKVFPTGLPVLFGNWIEVIVLGQRRGLLFALLMTTLMMVLSLRLFWPGVISMVPNALPLVVLGGYVGWLWDTVDSDTVLIAMIAIGIAVDDTVHFMTRFKIEAQRTNDIDTALRQTFFFTGQGIVKTSVILCMGFLPFSFSDYFTTRIMGTLLPLTLLMALVADLLLLPALVKLRILRMPMRR